MVKKGFKLNYSTLLPHNYQWKSSIRDVQPVEQDIIQESTGLSQGAYWVHVSILDS